MIIPISYRQSSQLYGLQSKYIGSKYIAVENNNLKDLAEKLGIDSSEIPDKIELEQSATTLEFTQEEKNHELEEKSLRNQAELINYRKRKEEETARLMKYSNESLVKEVLPILDNFERAIDMDDDNLDDEVSKFLEGFKMVYTQINNMLDKFEVKEIEAFGKEFDPTYHQAVMKETNPDKESGIVLEVFQKGYMYKDRVIRPSMVKVNE